MVNESVKMLFVFPSATLSLFEAVVDAPPNRVWFAVMVLVPLVERINPLGVELLFDPAWTANSLDDPLNVSAVKPEKSKLDPFESPVMVLLAELLMISPPPVTVALPLPPETVVSDVTSCVLPPRFSVPPPRARALSGRAWICPKKSVPLRMEVVPV